MKHFLKVIESVYNILGCQSPKIVIASSRTSLYVYVRGLNREDLLRLMNQTELNSVYPDDDNYLCLQINIEVDEDEES